MKRPGVVLKEIPVDSLMTDLILSALDPLLLGRLLVDRPMYAIRIQKFWKGFQKRVLEVLEEMLSEQIKPTKDE